MTGHARKRLGKLILAFVLVANAAASFLDIMLEFEGGPLPYALVSSCLALSLACVIGSAWLLGDNGQ